MREWNEIESEYPKCLAPDCIREGPFRGLCQVHYSVAERLVKAGRTTWESLVTRKKILPIEISAEERWLLDLK